MSKQVVLKEGVESSLNMALRSLAEAAKKYPSTASRAGGTGGNNAVYGYVDDEKVHQSAYPCHRHLMNAPLGGKTKAIYSVMCKPLPGALATDEMKLHFDWLTSREDSPWRSLFTLESSKDSKNSKEYLSEDYQWENGFLFQNLLDIPANLLMNFLVASRMPAEWPHTIHQWYRLVKEEHIDPALAYIALQAFEGHGDGPYALNKSNFYDWPIDNATCDEQYVLNFLRGVPGHPSPNFGTEFVDTKNNHGGYAHGQAKFAYVSINDVWGNNECTPTASYLHQLELMYVTEFGKKANRKSSISSTGRWSLTYTDLCALLRVEEARLLSVSNSKKAKA